MKYISLPISILRRKISTRWWWALLRINFILLFACPFNSFAQTIFDRVHINPADRTVTINWHHVDNSYPVIDFIIQEEKLPGQNEPIPNLPPILPNSTNQYSYTFQYDKVFSQPVNFNVLTEYGNGYAASRTIPSHRTIFTTLQYDTCSNSIEVKWTPYLGWGDNIAKYVIFFFNNPVLTRAAEVSADTTFDAKIKITDLNKNYCFIVAAIPKVGQASYSNNICIGTNSLPSPSYIVGNYTKMEGNNNVNLQFSTDPAITRGSFKLSRTEAGANNWSSIASFNTGATITYSDALPDLKVYDYQLSYLNICNQEVLNSVPINNIVLTGTSEAMTNNLSWNSFKTWTNGVDRIEIYRNDQSNPITVLSPSSTSYSDVLSAQAQLADKICYQVKAVSLPDPLGKVNTSESNIFCAGMLGEVFVGNAFTPNNDGKNDEFKPSFSLIPTKYSFIVYNRYGFKIFETSDPGKGWNGRLSDGTIALEGGYIYYLKIVSSSGKVLEKRGNFSVIYP